MSDKKQTAVDWLIKKLTNRQNGVFDGFPHLSVDEIYDKAKEMEKEQLIDVAQDFSNNKLNRGVIDKWYNETYGGSK